MNNSIFISAPARNLCVTLLAVCIVLLSPAFAQPHSVLTNRGDNARSGANTNETLLTPTNVNKNGFGKIFSAPIDYVAMAQPLYVPNVSIPGQGIHDVVYVVTQADSVYAIDADNGAQLWYASMLNGGTTASGIYLPCGTAVGFNQEGIVGTPVIDPNTNTMYLVAKTLLGTTVRHHIHALDITTGNEQPGSPVLIQAQSTSKKGHVTVFSSLHQKNRPGMLLLNGKLYLGFGSNYCNDGNSAWVLSYDAASLTQTGVFNASPDYGITSIWQTGNGLAADEAGYIYAETSESGSHGYDVPAGGETYCMSVLKLAADDTLADYFTPWNVAFLNSYDLDMSSAGPVVLPDQDGPFPHELIASGKYGQAFVLNRDSLGLYSAGDSQVLQEITVVQPKNPPVDVMMSSPAYWNNTVYFTPDSAPIMAYPLSGGLLGTPVTAGKYAGGHSASISANGNSNGILWVISGPQLLAFDAVSLKLLYSTSQALGGRDKMPAVGHFATQTVADGKVYVATTTSLEAYGLFHLVSITGGDGQSGTVNTALPVPIQVNVSNPYSGQPDPGATVTFSDGAKGGLFSPSTTTTDSNGNAVAYYTLPKKSGTYTLTINLKINNVVSGTATATAAATPGAATTIVAYGGAKQTAAAGSTLGVTLGTNLLIAQAQDANKNGISGITINFTANNGGIVNPTSVVTDATGLARTTLQLPTTVVSTITVTATSSGFKQKPTYFEYSIAGPAAIISITGGNSQSAAAGTQLPQALTVLVTDQYGNSVHGVGVVFDDAGAGGTFSNANPFITNAAGAATQFYKLPPAPGAVTINTTVSGVANPTVFNETGQ